MSKDEIYFREQDNVYLKLKLFGQFGNATEAGIAIKGIILDHNIADS